MHDDWLVMRDGQICPTEMPCTTRDEAIQTAKVLARYDDAAYTVAQRVYTVVPEGEAVEVRRARNGRMVERETYAPGEGRRGGA